MSLKNVTCRVRGAELPKDVRDFARTERMAEREGFSERSEGEAI
jgi:hypothetical protein